MPRIDDALTFFSESVASAQPSDSPQAFPGRPSVSPGSHLSVVKNKKKKTLKSACGEGRTRASFRLRTPRATYSPLPLESVYLCPFPPKSPHGQHGLKVKKNEMDRILGSSTRPSQTRLLFGTRCSPLGDDVSPRTAALPCGCGAWLLQVFEAATAAICRV